MRLCVKDIDAIRKNTHDAIMIELYKICKRYLESKNLKICEGSKIRLDKNCFDVILFIETYYRVFVGFEYGKSYYVSISLSGNYREELYKYSSKYSDGYVIENIDWCSSFRKVYEYFKSPTDFIEYISHIYDKLYNTNYYYNLQSVTTFILVCRNNPIFPKDIYLLIAKKILKT